MHNVRGGIGEGVLWVLSCQVMFLAVAVGNWGICVLPVGGRKGFYLLPWEFWECGLRMLVVVFTGYQEASHKITLGMVASLSERPPFACRSGK